MSHDLEDTGLIHTLSAKRFSFCVQLFFSKKLLSASLPMLGPTIDIISRIRKGKTTLSFPALPWETLSSGEFADRVASLLFVKLDYEIRQYMAFKSK